MFNSWYKNTLPKWFNYPQLNFKAIPRIAKGLTEWGGESTWTWYDKTGAPVERDESQHTQVYDAMGKRWVFARGTWQEDDPYAQRAFNHPLTTLFLNTAGQGNFHKVPFQPTGVGRILGIFGQQLPAPNQTFTHMDLDGNYLDDQGKPIEPGTLAWLRAKWGEKIPDAELDNLIGQAFDLDDPFDEVELDDMVYRLSRWNNQGLVKVGKPPAQYGDVFYIHGQRAVMGTPDNEGIMQYAVTEPGSGDRWKYKITKDADGNWVRTYYKTYGAKKEKQERLKRKGKDE